MTDNGSMISLNIETVLMFVIALITIQLLIVGIYIIMLLRDTRRTVGKAEKVIDDIDKSVKDGIEKASAMQAPLAALATTTTAVSNMMKGAGSLRDMTKSVISASRMIKGPSNTEKKADMPVNIKTVTTAESQTVTDNGIAKDVGLKNSVGSQSMGNSSTGAVVPNDYSVNDWNVEVNVKANSPTNVKAPVNNKPQVVSLAENITTVTPPSKETTEESNTQKKKGRKPRFFRKK